MPQACSCSTLPACFFQVILRSKFQLWVLGAVGEALEKVFSLG